MSERRRGLGRGLGALIPDAPAAAPAPPRAGDAVIDTAVRLPDTPVVEHGPAGAHGDGARPEPSGGWTPRPAPRPAPAAPQQEPLPVPGVSFAELPVGAISPNPRQPRKVFDEDAHAELVHSVREIGVLQPVVVRPVRGGTRSVVEGQLQFELVMGERRWRAAGSAGLATVPAIVRETADDALLRDALLENLHRADLNPLEEAAAYQQLLDDFGCTHESLAQQLGRSRPQISNTLRLLRLPPSVARRVAAGVLSAGHARAILGLPDGGAMERLAQRVVAEGLSVRATEEVVALGGDTERTAAPSVVRRAAAPVLDDLAARLSDRFETRVSVAMGAKRGRLTVEFATLEDLDRILGTLAPEDPGVAGASDDQPA